MDAFKWKLPKSRIISRINFLSLLIIIGTIVYVILVYPGLPEEIPIHFNLLGEADSWGGKATILVMPFTLLTSMGLVYGFSKMPQYFHEGKLDERDKTRYLLVGKHLTIINLILALILFYIPFSMTQIAHQRSALEPWILLILLVMMGIITIRMVIVAPKKRRNKSRKIK